MDVDGGGGVLRFRHNNVVGLVSAFQVIPIRRGGNL